MTTVPSFDDINLQPAAYLVGVELVDGWRVAEMQIGGPGRTGGNFSIGYRAERFDSDGTATGEVGFVKAIDFSKAHIVSPTFLVAVRQMAEAFIFEREVVEKCTKRNMKHVIRGYCHGEVSIGTGATKEVSYITF